MARLPIIALCVLCSSSAGAESLPEGDVCADGACDASQASALLQVGKGETSNGPDTVRQTRDNCPYKVAEPVSLNQAAPWNITAELPQALFMKHAGWAPDASDRGIGVFAARPFKKGEEIGSALARVAACDDQASVETPAGIREIRCDIHLFDLPEGSGSSVDDLAVFPSWMSFLNYPDDEVEEGPAAEGNVEWAASTCSHPSGAPQWRLVASEDIAPQAELRLVYDEDSSSVSWKKMMRRMTMKKSAWQADLSQVYDDDRSSVSWKKMMRRMTMKRMAWQADLSQVYDDDRSSASSASTSPSKLSMKKGMMKSMKK